MHVRNLGFLVLFLGLLGCDGDTAGADGGGGGTDAGGLPVGMTADCTSTPASIDIGGGDRGYGHICFNPADGACTMFRSDETFPPCDAGGTIFMEAGGGTPGVSEDTYRYMRAYGLYWVWDSSSHGEITNEDPRPGAANRLNDWPGSTEITVVARPEQGSGAPHEIRFRLDGRTWTLLSIGPS